MSTSFMLLDLPTPTITVGPLWAEKVNLAFERIDQHDHSSGNGVKIKPTGIDINSSLDMQTNQLLNAQALQLSTLPANLLGPLNTLKLHSVGGNLWFTNINGTAVQLTSGGALASIPGSAQLFAAQSVTSDLTILSTDQFVYLLVDTSIPRTITLPFASSLSAGRVYIIKDINGTAVQNPITIQPQVTDLIDGATSYVMDIEFGCVFVVTDGATRFYLS